VAVARYGDSVQKPGRRAAARAGFLLALLEELVSGGASAEALSANDTELFLDVFAAMYARFHIMALSGHRQPPPAFGLNASLCCGL
jgi:hypothetical protein